jgi:hypothetical protein
MSTITKGVGGMDSRSLWPTQNDLPANVRAGAVDLLNQQK